jgi:hypothetical protein
MSAKQIVQVSLIVILLLASLATADSARRGRRAGQLRDPAGDWLAGSPATAA